MEQILTLTTTGSAPVTTETDNSSAAQGVKILGNNDGYERFEQRQRYVEDNFKNGTRLHSGFGNETATREPFLGNYTVHQQNINATEIFNEFVEKFTTTNYIQKLNLTLDNLTTEDLIDKTHNDFGTNNYTTSNSSVATTNQESFDDAFENDNFWQPIFIIILKVILMVGIIVIAVLGNILVIVSISLNRKLRSLANHFLISLATADIMVGVCAMSFNASVQLSGRWLFGPVVCDLWNSFDVYFSTVSILHLCCISMDRYYAIIKPLEYPIYMTRRVVFAMIISSWLLPTLISFVPIFLGWYATQNHLLDRAQNPGSCTFEVNTAYALISSGLSFWFPCTVMLFMYFRIFQEARKQEAAIMSRTNSSCNMNNVKKKISGPFSISSIITCLASINCRRPWRQRSESKDSHADVQLHHLPEIAEAARKSRSKMVDFKTDARHSVTESVISVTRCSIGSSPCLCSLTDKEISIERFNTIPTDGKRRASVPIHDHTNNTNPSTEKYFPAFQPPIDSINDIVSSVDTYENPKRQQPFSVASSDVALDAVEGERCIASHSQRHRSLSGSSSGAESKKIVVGQPAPLMKREHKAARTLGIIMGAFILCWLPFFTWYVASNICGEACFTPEPVVTLLFWIGYFNSTLNPFIYAYFRADFREAFRKTLRQMRCAGPDSSSYYDY